MPPSRNTLHLGSSQAKKQQTISNFFTKKTPATPSSRTTLNDATTSKEDTPAESPVATRKVTPLKRTADEEDDSDVENGSHHATKIRKVSEDTPAKVANEVSTARPSSKEREVLKEHQVSNVSPARPVVRTPTQAERTSRYLFSTNPAPREEEPESDEEEIRKQKQKLHERFVKKLGRPDSIAEIKRRTPLNAPAAEGEDGEDEEGGEDEEPTHAKGRKGVAAKKSTKKLTPMLQQVVDIKKKHMDTILVVEVGYKFNFFGEDARVAAKELHIVCIPGRFRFDEHPSEAHLDINHFAKASFPVHRLGVHVKRLVQAGHKVGVVRQLETAALKKVGDNRNAPFTRKLTNLYTKGTFVDDIEGLEGPTSATGGAPSTGYLLCITETNAKGWGNDEKVHVGLLAVQPMTGDIIYDDFEDGFMRSEIETRLIHLAPCEFLIVGDLSKATEKMVKHLSGSKTNVFGDQARVERVEKPKTMAAQAYSHVSNFYADKLKEEGTSEGAGLILDKAHQLSEHVTVCLSAMITHMTEYGLEHVFDLTKYFQPFSARSHMLLNGNTLTSLEIYQNQTDHREKGSLFWALDRTNTRFGRRLLRKWIGQPLLDRKRLEERVSAVEELKDGEQTLAVEKLKGLLARTKSDLEKSLMRISYKKCTRPELLTVLQTLQRISTEYSSVTSPEKAGFDSPLLNEAIASLPKISDIVISFLDKINLQAAKDDDKYGFLQEDTDPITEHKLAIVSIEHDLDEHRSAAAAKIKKKKVEYITVSGIEYLIEVTNADLKHVPASWTKISGRKGYSRFHTPEVVRFIQERDQHKEALAAACDSAFLDLLASIAEKYQYFRDCVQSLATLDCLLSLADVASRTGYTKPVFVEENRIDIVGGRHPMVEQLLLDAYVPNDVTLSSDGTRALLITGPNMGGKSSYVRSVALIAIMAQTGSYVPATSATLGMLDAVYTRMGAFDNMMTGESTFMVELHETSDILKTATPRSLVILDELGRGTSTHDGVAIAQAVLEYMLNDIKSFTLFITHYQDLSAMERRFEGVLKNVHMKFTESGAKGKEEITFLYEVGEGVAHRSYG